MMRMLPGTIRECSGPPVSATGGGSGYHPGEKVLTDADRAVPAEWVTGLNDGVAVVVCDQYVTGFNPADYERYTPLMEVTCRPPEYWNQYETSTLSFLFTGFVTDVFEVGNEDWETGGGRPFDFDASDMSMGINVTDALMPTQEHRNLVVEAFGMVNSAIRAAAHAMPLNDGKCSKHLPLFY